MSTSRGGDRKTRFNVGGDRQLRLQRVSHSTNAISGVHRAIGGCVPAKHSMAPKSIAGRVIFARAVHLQSNPIHLLHHR